MIDGPYAPFVNGTAHADQACRRVLEIVSGWDDGAINEKTSVDAVPSQVFFIDGLVAFATAEHRCLVLDVMTISDRKSVV